MLILSFPILEHFHKLKSFSAHFQCPFSSLKGGSKTQFLRAQNKPFASFFAVHREDCSSPPFKNRV